MFASSCPAPDQDDSFEQLRRHQDDVLTSVQAAEHLGWATVRWAIRDGRWQQPSRGVVVCHNGPLTLRQRLWVAVLAGPPGTALAGPTAATSQGLAGFESDLIHVVVGTGARGFYLPNVVVHRSSKLGPEHIHPVLEPRRTRLPRSLLDMASWAPSDDMAQAALAAGVQQRLVPPEALRDAVKQRGRFTRSRLVRETIDDLADGAHSLPELEFGRIICRKLLPRPDRQRIVQRPDGRRYLDADWLDYGVSAEVHGIPHMWVRRWDDDLDRITDLVADGRRILQFTSYAVRHRAERVGERMERALRTGGWTR